MTRSTMKAGQTKAGDALDGAPGDSLLDLLSFNTTAEGVRVGDSLRERLEAAEREAEEHAAHADDAALAGEAAQQAHEAEAARHARHIDRLRLAITRADARLADVAEGERRAEGERHARAAQTHASRAEEAAAAYAAAARTVAEKLAALIAEYEAVSRERSAAYAADVECTAQLPHEARARPARYEEREIVTRQRPPGVYDAAGRRLDGNGDAEMIVTRRMERVCVDPGCRAPDLTRARMVLPDPDGGMILDRGAD